MTRSQPIAASGPGDAPWPRQGGFAFRPAGAIAASAGGTLQDRLLCAQSTSAPFTGPEKEVLSTARCRALHERIAVQASGAEGGTVGERRASSNESAGWGTWRTQRQGEL